MAPICGGGHRYPLGGGISGRRRWFFFYATFLSVYIKTERTLTIGSRIKTSSVR